ncbi:nucleotidyltransferase domain-containing protein [Kitasatospora cineracea]|uniref:nucleotidyltransferase domain-containing protein n=1 Tax=Kitasatospora cineracea TaxID=88074 RepID=UPI00382566ED
MSPALTTAPATIAFSGPDNVGKTKQLGILLRRLGPAGTSGGPLDAFDLWWSDIIAGPGGMGGWWWEHGPVEAVADVLASSYLERARRLGDAPVRLVDRGIPMLEATLAATVAVREGLSADAAADRALKLLEPFRAGLAGAEAAEFGVLLLHHEDPEVGAARALSHEKSVTPAYAAYQRHLHAQLHRLAADGRWSNIIVVNGRPVVAVQDELRRLLHQVVPAVPARALPGVRVVALGGLSECGKSSAGEYLRVQHGHARLKIGYLLEDAARWAGVADPYALPPVLRAELLVDALDRYCAAHHFLDRVTVESLHEYDSTTELRRMLSDQLSILYLDAEPEVRARRGTAGPLDVVDRDEVKVSRGADRIAALAHAMVDNNGSRLRLERQLDMIALGSRWPLRTPTVAPVNTLGLPVNLEAYLAELLDRTTVQEQPVIDLLAVTGSGARGKYQRGWSDLDVFVIADPAGTAELRRVLEQLEADLGGVKLGLTVLTEGECRSGMVTSRLLHVLALLGSGSLAAQWCRPGLVLPAPDLTADVAASVKAGVQGAVEIRRQLLKGTPDLRALYKVSALLAKVLLRFDGVEMSADEDALAALLSQVAGAGPRRVNEDRSGRDQAVALAELELVRDARRKREKAVVLAELVLAHWLATTALPGGR